jgi:LuxR family transcriptional regulator, maltose regulon positive regulatory protein
VLRVSATHTGSERPEAAPIEGKAASPYPAGVSPHKLFAPTPFAGAIERTGILSRVTGSRDCRIVFLQGPAGHGKSTTLQQFQSVCEAEGCQTLWLTLDDADNDPRRLVMHLQAMLEQLPEVRTHQDPEGDMLLSGRRRADWILTRLARLGRRAAIFLDEFQVIRNRSVLAFFRDLCERVPDNVRIFIGSRSLPDIGLAKLLVNRVALIVSADDLRFSREEVGRFFTEATDLEISGEEIGTIYRRTEGWPAALQLYRLTLASPDVRGSLGDLARCSPRQLAEYLADNVLALQSPRTRTFLLRTSLLTRLTGPLCDVVTGRSDSSEMLIGLERSGMFLRSLDAEGRWYKYHGLFSTILAESFTGRAEAQALEVHRRAAHWHLAEQQFEDAIHHALCAGDFCLAAVTLDEWSSSLIGAAHLMTVERWFDRIPFEFVAARPSLAVKVAWALMFLRRNQKLPRLLEHLGSVAAGSDRARTDESLPVLAMAQVFEDDLPGAFESACAVLAKGGADAPFNAFELGATYNVIAYRNIATGDFEAERRSLVHADALNKRVGATFSEGYTKAIAGLGLILQGRLPEALERFHREAMTDDDQIDKSFASAALAACHIWALYEANELAAAGSLCGQYLDDITGSVIPDFICVAMVSMARLHDVHGRNPLATELLEMLERIGQDSGWASLIRAAGWERARRALISGDVERARSIVANLPDLARPLPREWIQLTEDLGGEALGRIRLAIHEGNLGLAGTELSRELARQPARVYRRIRLHLLEALLRQREGANNAAHRSLQKALSLGMPGRYIRCFLDEGEGVVRLLREAYRAIHEHAERGDPDSDRHRTFIEQLLAASGTDLSRVAPSSAPTLLEPLSGREQQILLFLGDGISNRDMAARLFVSENTVKFHLKNIYQKLAVGSRLQAISKARRLGMV